MKIGIYSDLHISYTSSIMPLYHTSDSKYTTRLDMIVNTARWMYELFKDNNVDVIANCGDTLDSNNLRAEEITALSDFYSYSKRTTEIVIPGNHEMLDSELEFYSSHILKNIGFTKVYDSPTKLDDTISVLPYTKTENITPALLKSISNKVLFSHIDIAGSHLRPDYIMDSGTDPELLAEYFDIVINGHLHTPEIIKTTKNKVINIGSVSSMSFNDNNQYVPSVCIYDTETGSLDRHNNPCAILFRRYTCNNLQDVMDKLSEVRTSKYKHIVRFTVPYEIVREIRSVLATEVMAANSNIVSYRVVSKAITHTERVTLEGKPQETHKVDLTEEFSDFIKQGNTPLLHPVASYMGIINELDK